MLDCGVQDKETLKHTHTPQVMKSKQPKVIPLRILQRFDIVCGVYALTFLSLTNLFLLLVG